MTLLVYFTRGDDPGTHLTLLCTRMDHKIARGVNLHSPSKTKGAGEEPPHAVDWGKYTEYFYFHCVFASGTDYDAAREAVKTWWRYGRMGMHIGEASEVDYITEDYMVFVSLDGGHDSGTNEWTGIIGAATTQAH